MIEGLSNNKGSLSETTESKLSKLIDSGDSVDLALLKGALDNKEITQDQYITLINKLLKQKEWIEDALANVGKKLGTQVEELAIDPLTKLFARALLAPKLNDLIKELNSSELHHRKSDINAIMVIALDMNGLKFFNDSYDHITGDHALIALAERIKKTTRRNDILFRPGGDEFVVFLPIENRDADFKEIFQKFRNGINTNLHIITKKDGKSFPITSSMGYSVSKKGDFKTAKELLSEADKNERKDNRKIKSKESK